MKKHIIGLVFASILVMITSQAWGAQVQVRSASDPNVGAYLSTFKRTYTDSGWVNNFNADGKSNYPYEIYLPNENRPDQYRIHTSYTKNTDACASCHATHTAVSSSLLQWYSVYETCMACHDGTVTTTYNVEQGTVRHFADTNQITSGGAFGTGKERSLSYHNVTGGVMIGTAPGGNPSTIGTKNNLAMGCESCHTPHGMGGNARILNPDPNGVQSQKENQYRKYTLLQLDYNSSTSMVTYAAYPKDSLGVINTVYTPYYMLKGYPYTINIYSENTKLDDVIIDNSAGYTKVIISESSITGNVTADFVPSLRVRMKIDNYLGFTDQGATVAETVYYRDGTMEFCSGCHGEYGKNTEGMSNHHPVARQISHIDINKDSELYLDVIQYKFEDNKVMVCLTCHVAHGVSEDYWIKSAGYPESDAYELAGSSALKRAPNSAICLVCHPKDVENQGYFSNSGQLQFSNEPDVYDASFNQPMGVDNFVGLNVDTCDGSCHTPIVNEWKTTAHSNTIKTNSPAFSNAAEFQTETDKTVSDIVYVVGTNKLQRFVYNDNGTLRVTKNEYNLLTDTWTPKNPVGSFINSCAGCHVTGLNVATNTWTDKGVACEACHGAGAKHVTVRSSLNITNPRYISMPDQTDMCAQCHSLGYSENSGVYRPYPVDFTLNQRGLNSVDREVYTLSAYYTVYGSADYPGNFYNPNPGDALRDSAFSAQQFNDYIQTKHYESKVMGCTTCHSSHKKNLKGKMLKGSFEQLCGACHDTSFNINTVMPKRINYTGNAEDNLRVHTFSKQHDTASTPVTGLQINIH